MRADDEPGVPTRGRAVGPAREITTYDSIQGLRFVAALLVIACHATAHTTERLDPTLGTYYLGANGVPLFFVISGFVMMLSADHLRLDPRGWRIFALKRIIRIVPLYWLVTTAKLMIFFAAAAFVRHARFSPSYLIHSYLFIPAVNDVNGRIEPFYGVGWTLQFEMFFYLLVGLFLFLRRDVFQGSVVILLGLAIVSLWRSPDWPATTVYADALVLDFAFGMAAAKLIGRRIHVPRPLGVLGIIGGLAYLFVPSATLLPFLPNAPFLFNPVLMGLAAFLVVYAAASLETTHRLRPPRIIVYLGAASYSLYLAHPMISPIMPEILKRAGLIWPYGSVFSSVCLSLIGGCLVYRYVEQPMTIALTGLAGGRRLAQPTPAPSRP